jgi:hypothetical protein
LGSVEILDAVGRLRDVEPVGVKLQHRVSWVILADAYVVVLVVVLVDGVEPVPDTVGELLESRDLGFVVVFWVVVLIESYV